MAHVASSELSSPDQNAEKPPSSFARKRLGRRCLAVQERAQPRPVERGAVGLDEGCRTDEVHPAAIVAFREQRIHLHDVQGRQVLRPGAPGAGEHLPVVPPGREDRRARPERGGQDRPLLRIMAGKEEPSSGMAELAPGRKRRAARAGALARPRARRARQRRRRRAARSATCSIASTRSRRHSPSPTRTSTCCSPSRRRCRTRSTARTRGSSTIAIDHAMDALRVPDGRSRRRVALRRRAPARRALPLAALRAGSAAARRADEPPRRRVRRVARALPRGLQGHRRRRHARPLLPRQRRRMDSRARPRPRHSVPGQLLVVARAEAGAPRRRGEAGRRRASARSRASSSGCE